MKTTIKLTTATALEVFPLKTQNVIALSKVINGEVNENGLTFLTHDQASVLIFALEQALEVHDQRHKAAIEAMKVAA